MMAASNVYTPPGFPSQSFPNPNQPYQPSFPGQSISPPGQPYQPGFPGQTFPSPSQPYQPGFPGQSYPNPNQPYQPSFPGQSYPNPNQPYQPSFPGQSYPNPNQPFQPSFPGQSFPNPNQPFQPSFPGQPQPTSWNLVHGNTSRQPPPNAVLSQQKDGLYACVVAHTKNGEIPGKAKDGNCWYPYGGREHQTTNFSWLIVPGGSNLQQSKGQVPPLAIACGNQTDGSGVHYAAVATTGSGQVPGKAKAGKCWYSFGGFEVPTTNFMYVCSNQ
jgi:hypothetical protein